MLYYNVDFDLKVKIVFFRVLLFVLFFFPSVAKAHPHAWIDMETAVLFDDKGMVTGLRVGWLFDDFYSAFSMEGIQPTQKRLNELAEANLKNLSEYNYFTQMKVEGQLLKHKPVETYTTQLIGNRLWLEFDVMLETAINPKKQSLTYAIFDPTYYVEILYSKEGDPIRMVGNSSGCGYAVKLPEPPKEMSLMAAALDKTETAGDTIGTYFAEKVTLSCR